ncbi:amidohydrolase [Gilvibacter sp.]|uniref:amidohydrolase n=1 Tax=Gilvibacter sp. TaxID=2729997 RepID=UPI0025BD6112|nr:amidohydrolase [Gilvibacter sp.]NQX76429.1 amidohydrolase [Gilvibacter sp.]
MSKKSQLNVGILQQDLVWEDQQANRDQFEAVLNDIASKCDLVVLPEMFTTGFSMNAADLWEPVDGPTTQWMQQMAAKYNSAITGSIIIKQDDHYYNRLLFVYPDGQYKTYDKRHCFTLAGEHEVYTAGTERLHIELHGWLICPLICYDLRFPVWARNTSNYDLLLYVANWPKTRIKAWDTLLQARAIENMSYCVGVNRIGDDGNGYPYVGHTAVYDPLGERISTADFESPIAEIVSLDAAYQDKVRDKLRFLNDRDSFTLEV